MPKEAEIQTLMAGLGMDYLQARNHLATIAIVKARETRRAMHRMCEADHARLLALA